MLPDLNSLYQNLHQRLRAFILRRVNDEAAAEDILQDVFLKIHTRLAKFAKPPSTRLPTTPIDHYRRLALCQVDSGL